MKKIRDMTFEEKKELLAGLNVIDDTFFHKIIEDKDVAEEILRVILSDKELVVLETYPQDSIRSIIGKSVVLDALIRDSAGRVYNVEMQKGNEDDYVRRARYNQSSIDTRFSEKGVKYGALPDIYEIFILKFDIFKAGKTVYNIERIVKETGEISNNGVYEMYINATSDDGSEISELMKYFLNTRGMNGDFPRLSERVDYFKNQEEGVNDMCEFSEMLLREGRTEGFEESKNMIAKAMKDGNEPFEKIAKFTGLTLEAIEAL